MFLLWIFVHFQLHCTRMRADFLLGDSQMGWQTAEDWCMNNHGRHLASIHDPAQSAAAINLCNGNRCWIGGSCRRFQHGQWSWTDGTNWGFTHWDSDDDQPNDYGGEEDCVQLRTSGLWNDQECSAQYLPLCGNRGIFIPKI